MNINVLSILISVVATAFFAGLIIWINFWLFRRQRKFDLKKSDYKEATEKLANIDKRLASIWAVRDAEALGLSQSYIDKKIREYEKDGENITNIHAGIQYFPELHILAVSINNDFSRRLDSVKNAGSKYSGQKGDLEIHGNIGLRIMNEITKIRWILAYDILHYKIKEIKLNEEYGKRVNEFLDKNPTRKEYKDDWNKRKRFDEFRSIIMENK